MKKSDLLFRNIALEWEITILETKKHWKNEYF